MRDPKRAVAEENVCEKNVHCRCVGFSGTEKPLNVSYLFGSGIVKSDMGKEGDNDFLRVEDGSGETRSEGGAYNGKSNPKVRRDKSVLEEHC